MDKQNYGDAELKMGPKISNKYGDKSFKSSIPILGGLISEYVSVKAVCEEIIGNITVEIIDKTHSDKTHNIIDTDRTHIYGDTVNYTYYLMRSYPYDENTPYMTILNRETYLEPVDIKPGKLYTMTFKYNDLSLIICDKTSYNKGTFLLDSSSFLNMIGFKQVLLYDKDIMLKDHHSGILHEKDRIEDVSHKDHIIGLFNAETFHSWR